MHSVGKIDSAQSRVWLVWPIFSVMRPVITGTNANGEGGGVEWVKVGPSQVGAIDPAQVRTMAKRVEGRKLIWWRYVEMKSSACR
jgi:hypothetical protein